MATNVELYRGLCEHLSPEAAKLIAEALPEASGLATRSDVERLGQQILELKADIFRWMLTFFASLWLGLAGLVVAVVLGG